MRVILRHLDPAGLAWAQETVTEHHYLHKPVDSRAAVEGWSIDLEHPGLKRIGLLLVSRPQATKCGDWYGSVDDVAGGRCEVTRWQVLCLSRVYLAPIVQGHVPDSWHPCLPGFTDRKGRWRSTLPSTALRTLAADVGWCHLNDEGGLLARLIPDAVQVSGADSDDAKEERAEAFISGEARVLVSKPRIFGWGLNLQHCAHVAYFPTHSFEAFYQAVRRCWRFGQTRPVVVDLVRTDADSAVLANLQRKAAQADAMFASLVRHMHDALVIERGRESNQQVEVPAWLAS